MIIPLILVLLAGFFNSLMDLSAEGLFFKQWLNKDQSWTNKYRIAIRFSNMFGMKAAWAWLFKNPLVFITDGWHLFQFLCMSCFSLAIIVALNSNSSIGWLILFLILKLSFSLGFQPFYGMYKKYSLHRRRAKE